MDRSTDYPQYEDRIEKFCLPLLRAAGSDVAVNHVMRRLLRKPHQIRLYFFYISTFVVADVWLSLELQEYFKHKQLISEYQKMFLLAAMMKAPGVAKETVNVVIHWLQDRQVIKEVKAMAAISASRHGNSNQKRTVRLEYENEPSEYVRSAILYSSRFFTKLEKDTCKKAWGGHRDVNSLIAKVI